MTRREATRLFALILIEVGAVLTVITMPLYMGWTIQNDRPDHHAEIEKLITALHQPKNKVRVGMDMIPGGEILTFSPPMEKLIKMGDIARKPLEQHLNDKDIQNEVAVVLGAIGDETTVPLLIAAYPDFDVCRETRDTFAESSERLKIVCFTHALTYLTSEPIGRSRWGCDCDPCNGELWREWWAKHHKTFTVSADKPLATWVPNYPTVVRPQVPLNVIREKLHSGLKDQDRLVRLAAVEGLRALESDAKASLPELRAALKDPDPEVRRVATEAFCDLTPESSAARADLVLALRDPDGDVRARAAYALQRIGTQCLADFYEALNDPVADVRRLAAESLGSIQPKPQEAVSRLLKASLDRDGDVRAAAFDSLGSLGQDRDDVVAALVLGLHDENAQARIRCAWRIASDKKFLLRFSRSLRQLLRDRDAEVRRCGLQILKEKDLLTREDVPNLILCLKHENEGVRSLAAEDLGVLGPAAVNAVAALRASLKDKDDSVRSRSAAALGKIGPAAREAIPQLIAASKDECFFVQKDAADALKLIDPNGYFSAK